MLKEWYEENVAQDMMALRNKMIVLLQEEEKLNEIVQLVGEDVLPNDQALILDTARIIKKGFLQQNAMHPEDTYVVLNKQYLMLKTIDTFYEEALKCVKIGIPISVIRKEPVIQDILKIKYEIPNDKPEALHKLMDRITDTYLSLRMKYE